MSEENGNSNGNGHKDSRFHLPPYVVDAPTFKAHTVEKNGDDRFLFQHELLALTAKNFPLLIKKEKETVRVSETISKGRVRPKFEEYKADSNLYKELTQAGGWRPYGLESYKDETLIPKGLRNLYSLDEKTGEYVPGWNELTRADCLRFTPEKMKNAIDKALACKGEIVSVGDGIDFMFEQAGTMQVRLLIGDPEKPSYRLLFEMRRPESQRRSQFRDSFAYGVEDRQGDLPKVETVINLRAGAKFFAEHFVTVVNDDTDHNPVVFVDKRTVLETIADGETPKPVSAVEVKDESVLETVIGVFEYSDDKKQEFLQSFNPEFQVEVAAAVIHHFNKKDQD